MKTNSRGIPAWAWLLPKRWACWLATLGPLGPLGPCKAPGTFGSLAGLIYYTVFFYTLSPLPYLLFLALTSFLAIGICGVAEVYFKAKDPGYIILDEFVAMPLCFLFLKPRWPLILIGFAVFRFFDILKPLGIRKIQKLPAGYGVVLDDLAAAGATCIALHWLSRVAG